MRLLAFAFTIVFLWTGPKETVGIVGGHFFLSLACIAR